MKDKALSVVGGLLLWLLFLLYSLSQTKSVNMSSFEIHVGCFSFLSAVIRYQARGAMSQPILENNVTLSKVVFKCHC